MTRQEILQKDNFNKVYEQLKSRQYVVLGRFKEITTKEDIAYSGTIIRYEDKKHLSWQHWGSSANDCTKKDFKWLLEEIFNDCTYFRVMTKEDYYKATDEYYKQEFKKRQRDLGV